MMMPQRDSISSTSLLNFEAWRALLRTICGRYNPEGIEHNAFIGWVRPMNVCGLAAVDIGWNAHRVERTHRDIRLDGAERYYDLFQVFGKSAMTQNDQAVQLAAGDVVLVDAARPMTYFRNDTGAQWLSVRLPRRFRVSHLGFEPQGGSCRRGGTPARRLLFSLVHDLDTDSGLQIRVCRFLHGAGCLRSRRRAICAVRSPAHHSPSGQAVRAYLRRDQGRLFRSGFWARR